MKCMFPASGVPEGSVIGPLFLFFILMTLKIALIFFTFYVC